MEKEEQDYVKAFNNGYLLAKHQPELLKKITPDLDRNNIYNDGLIAGKEEYEIEKSKSFFKKFGKGNDKEKTKDKNKDDKTIDR